MKIAVCIKQVPVDGNVRTDPLTHRLLRETAETEINAADLNALEAAIRCKKQLPGSEITVLTMGPADAEKSLRTALAVGADQGVLISDRIFGGADTLGTAKILAASLNAAGPFDLIVTGDCSADGATGQVGAMTAEALGIDSVAAVRNIRIAGSPEQTLLYLHVKRGNLEADICAAAPVLITIPYGSNEPPLPTLKSRIASRKAELKHLTNDQLRLDPDAVGTRGAKSIVTGAENIAASKQAELLDGSPEQIAGQIIRLLKLTG